MRFPALAVFVVLACFSPRILAACVLTDISSSGFPSTDGTSNVGTQQVGGVSVGCDGAYRIGLDAGMWSADTRRLSDGAGHFISYRLWRDSSARREWGDRHLDVVTYPAGTLNARSHGGSTFYPIFGTAGISANALPGEYRDVVKVTLAYPPYGPEDLETVGLQLSVHVTGTCTVDAAGVHGFGTWPAGGANLVDVPLGSVSVVCPSGVYYAVGMDSGLYYDGVQRRMSDGAGFVPYVLHAGAASGPEWGDAGLSAFDAPYVETSPKEAVYDRGTGAARIFYVWGDAQTEGIGPGAYRDTVNVTVVW